MNNACFLLSYLSARNVKNESEQNFFIIIVNCIDPGQIFYCTFSNVQKITSFIFKIFYETWVGLGGEFRWNQPQLIPPLSKSFTANPLSGGPF
ncbi:MAG: hypothetical protein CM15mP23_23050 [Cryomorphaceae bacterium]|nr:MAG: hypothetical protein CM15mP23_23050 [Cryomorphaceae bacterium]